MAKTVSLKAATIAISRILNARVCHCAPLLPWIFATLTAISSRGAGRQRFGQDAISWIFQVFPTRRL